MYLGVGKDETTPDAVAAHAWLCCGNTIVTGASGLERYTPLSSFFRVPHINPIIKKVSS
jgi:hypothetical protein